jgi:restriction system protein
MIPDFQSLMLPLLKRMADNEDHHANELIEVLSSDFNLTDE